MKQVRVKRALLAALFFIGSVGFGEGLAATSGQVRVENNASGLDCGNGCDKTPTNAFSPVNGGRVDAGQRGKNGSAEGGAGDGTAGLALAPERQAVGTESDKQPPDKGYECDGYCGLYLTIPLWILIYLTALFPPKTDPWGGFGDPSLKPN